MDLERSLLSHLTTVTSLKRMWDLGLRSDVFEDPVWRGVFLFSQEYWLNNSMEMAPTREAVEHEFPTYSSIPESEESVDWLCDALSRRYVTNSLQDSLRSVARAAGEGDPLGALATMYSESWDIIQRVTPRSARKDFSQDVEERRRRYQEKANFPTDVRGAPIGLEEVDRHTSGLLPGELAALVGYAKVGKSHMICHSAVSLRQHNYTPYLATLELSVEEMEDRLDAHASGLSYQKLQKGTLDRDEVRTLRESQDAMAGHGALHIEKPPVGERSVQYLINRARQLGCNVVLIDQLSFIEPRVRYSERRDSITEVMTDLKTEISHDESSMIPCYLAMQFNREVMTGAKEKRGRGELHQIALSSSIEQVVDIAYGLHQSRELRSNNSLLLDILGSRRVEPHSWLLQWELSSRTAIAVRDVADVL